MARVFILRSRGLSVCEAGAVAKACVEVSLRVTGMGWNKIRAVL